MVEQLSFRQKFIVLGIGIIFFLSFLFYGYSVFNSQDKIYYVHFKSSINGLREGSSVTYKGVDIGHVSSISVELPEADLVKVTIKVKHTFPIYSNYRAALSSRGFSGYYTIDLNQEDVTDQKEVLLSGSFILSKPSALEHLYEGVPEVVQEAKFLLQNLNSSLNKAQLNNLGGAFDYFSNSLRQVSDDFTQISSFSKLSSIQLFKNFLVLSQKFIDDYTFFYSEFSSKVFSCISVVESLALQLLRKVEGKDGVWKFVA